MKDGQGWESSPSLRISKLCGYDSMSIIFWGTYIASQISKVIHFPFKGFHWLYPLSVQEVIEAYLASCRRSKSKSSKDDSENDGDENVDDENDHEDDDSRQEFQDFKEWLDSQTPTAEPSQSQSSGTKDAPVETKNDQPNPSACLKCGVADCQCALPEILWNQSYCLIIFMLIICWWNMFNLKWNWRDQCLFS